MKEKMRLKHVIEWPKEMVLYQLYVALDWNHDKIGMRQAAIWHSRSSAEFNRVLYSPGASWIFEQRVHRRSDREHAHGVRVGLGEARVEERRVVIERWSDGERGKGK